MRDRDSEAELGRAEFARNRHNRRSAVLMSLGSSSSSSSSFYSSSCPLAGTNRDSCAALQQISKSLQPDADAKNVDAQRECFLSALDDVESELGRLVRELEYPETRMSHLLKLIGDKVTSFVHSVVEYHLVA